MKTSLNDFMVDLERELQRAVEQVAARHQLQSSFVLNVGFPSVVDHKRTTVRIEGSMVLVENDALEQRSTSENGASIAWPPPVASTPESEVLIAWPPPVASSPDFPTAPAGELLREFVVEYVPAFNESLGEFVKRLQQHFNGQGLPLASFEKQRAPKNGWYEVGEQVEPETHCVCSFGGLNGCPGYRGKGRCVSLPEVDGA